MCNIGNRSLGQGAGGHDEAQQDADDLKEMHDVLFGGVWWGLVRDFELVKRLQGSCQSVARGLKFDVEDRIGWELNRSDEILGFVRSERNFCSTKTDFGKKEAKLVW